MTDTQKTLVNIFGMQLPVIADLGDEWFLVAHPNGAAIANEEFLTVLWAESRETKLQPEGPFNDDGCGSPIPEAVRAGAVKYFEEFAWPFVRGQFYAE
ncbi:hypothetical protein LCGC14_2826250 [marine sediment metagenome]|uniref:Uncharacterized protein n=1 Tax=marine sediment metagenome TaxID=412755 RepID=A0A0F8YFG3_9ZZZZ